MPHYHFNVIDGVSTPDKEGSELADIQEARLEAIRLAGHVLLEEYKRVDQIGDWHMDVTDHTGLILLRLDLSVIQTAASMLLTSKAKQLAEA